MVADKYTSRQLLLRSKGCTEKPTPSDVICERMRSSWCCGSRTVPARSEHHLLPGREGNHALVADDRPCGRAGIVDHCLASPRSHDDFLRLPSTMTRPSLATCHAKIMFKMREDPTCTTGNPSTPRRGTVVRHGVRGKNLKSDGIRNYYTRRRLYPSVASSVAVAPLGGAIRRTHTHSLQPSSSGAKSTPAIPSARLPSLQSPPPPHPPSRPETRREGY